MDAINSFFSNIKDKLTNPFFGTLTLVLLFHHWKLIYSIFIFDEDCNMNDKLFIIQNYLSENITTKSFLLDVVYTVVIMFVGYLIIVFTRIMVIWVEHNVMPYFTGKIVNKNVVLKTLHDEVVKERDINFDKYEEQRDKVLEYSKLIDKQQEQINSKDNSISDLNDQLINKDEELNDQVKVIEKGYKKELDDLQMNNENEVKSLLKDNKHEIEKYENNVREFNNIFFTIETKDFYRNSINKLPPIIIETVNELIDNNNLITFLNIYDSNEISKIKNRRTSYSLHYIEILKDLGLLSSDSGEKFIKITLLGKIIYEYRNLFNKA